MSSTVLTLLQSLRGYFVVESSSLQGGLFFFKQKTAYEISLGLVGSEMCIRDSYYTIIADTVELM